ncbi:MAG: hypothetical protein AB8G22_28080 [Saprospiraceae bacterium]
MDKFSQQLSKFIVNDQLKEALELIQDFCEKNEEHGDLHLEVEFILGRLSKVENDRMNGVISVTEEHTLRNQIRQSILPIVKKIEHPDKTDREPAQRATPILEGGIKASNKLLQQNRNLDLIYKILLFAILIAGFVILLFSIASVSEFQERIYLGSVSMAGISSSFYFYTQLRGIEVMRYGAV